MQKPPKLLGLQGGCSCWAVDNQLACQGPLQVAPGYWEAGVGWLLSEQCPSLIGDSGTS